MNWQTIWPPNKGPEHLKQYQFHHPLQLLVSSTIYGLDLKKKRRMAKGTCGVVTYNDDTVLPSPKYPEKQWAQNLEHSHIMYIMLASPTTTFRSIKYIGKQG
jgi:hypothetical protein